MLRLLKYEFRKTRLTKLVMLGITALLEIVFLVSLFAGKENTTAMMAGGLTLVAFCGSVIIGIQSIVTLHRDMNTKEGYMLFMTPHSSFSILGAKVLECSLSLLAAGVFFFALGWLDVTLLFKQYGQLDHLMEYAQMFLHSINETLTLNTASCAAVVFNLLASWLAVITSAFLADVVSSSLLNGKKFNGIVTFLLFIAINWLMSTVTGVIVPGTTAVLPGLLLQGGIDLAYTVAMYIGTSILMARHLSV